MGASIVFAIPVLIAAAVFIGIGIFALKRETPMHFWSGTTVKTEEISDIKSYNKENGLMWILYGSTYILALMFENTIGAIMVGLSSTMGLIVLVFAYGRIYKKYKK